MCKFGHKITALLLAVAIAVSVVTPAFATGSPVEGKVGSDTTVDAVTTGSNTVAVTKVSSTSKTATVPAQVTGADGKTYDVSSIKTGSIKKKYDKVNLVLNKKTRVQSQVAKSKAAKKTKKIVIKAASGQKLTSDQFNKKAFKDFKGKVVVKKNSMNKKEYNKLKNKLRKGGFKGKIIYSK